MEVHKMSTQQEQHMAIDVSATPTGREQPTSGSQPSIKGIQRVVAHVALIALSLIFLIPFFWMVTGSIKNDAQLNAFPIVWFPDTIALGNYIYGLQVVPFVQYTLNTLIICVFSVVGVLFSSSFVAYGLSRIDWPLRTPLFVTILGTTMIPYYVTMIPLFTLFRTIGWTNTYLPLIVPTFCGVPIYIFLLR